MTAESLYSFRAQARHGKDNFSSQTANTWKISGIRVTIEKNPMKVLTDGRPQSEMPGFYWLSSTEGQHKVDQGIEILSLFLLITKRGTSIGAVIQLE